GQDREVHVVLVEQLLAHQVVIGAARAAVGQLGVDSVQPTRRVLRERQHTVGLPFEVGDVLLPDRVEVRQQRTQVRPLVHVGVDDVELGRGLGTDLCHDETSAAGGRYGGNYANRSTNSVAVEFR